MTHYSNLTPDDIRQGVDHAIDEAETVLRAVTGLDTERTFENTMRPLDRIADILDHAATDFTFMGYVHPDKEIRSAAKEAEEKRDKWAAEIWFRDDLYEAIDEYAQSREASELEGEHQRLLEFALRDLRRAGHELDPETRQRVKELTQREIELGVRFQQNIDEWDDWILMTREDLEGLPDAYIDGLDVDEETGMYKVTIAYPDMIPFLESSSRKPWRYVKRSPTSSVSPHGPTIVSRSGWRRIRTGSKRCTRSCAIR
jgi:thimet oligopeptidase